MNTDKGLFDSPDAEAEPHIMRYRVEGDRVIILRIRHGARAEEDS